MYKFKIDLKTTASQFIYINLCYFIYSDSCAQRTNALEFTCQDNQGIKRSSGLSSGKQDKKLKPDFTSSLNGKFFYFLLKLLFLLNF